MEHYIGEPVRLTPAGAILVHLDHDPRRALPAVRGTVTSIDGDLITFKGLPWQSWTQVHVSFIERKET